MYKQLWKNFHSSVCSISFFTENGIKQISLTGFKVNNYIVTDESIYQISRCDEVVFQFVKEDGFSINHSIRLSFSDFWDRINRLAEFEEEGYALIEIGDLDLQSIPSLPIEKRQSVEIGESIAIIGFHVDQDNMSLKNGIVSSFFKSENGKRCIQFDASIKLGNPGSPLINMLTGKVIGVVGYKMDAITKSYEAFKRIIDENLKMLKKSEGKMNIMDIDPIQVLIASQNQLKQVSREFNRSSQMSYGIAHELFTLSNYTFDNTHSASNNLKIENIEA